jgi:hypothetical protein
MARMPATIRGPNKGRGKGKGPKKFAEQAPQVQALPVPIEPQGPEAPPMPTGPAPVIPQVAGAKQVVHHQVDPNTRVSRVKEIIPHPSGPMIKTATHVNHQVSPDTVLRKSVIQTRRAAPNPNTRLRNSGHPNAFSFGKKPLV